MPDDFSLNTILQCSRCFTGYSVNPELLTDNEALFEDAKITENLKQLSTEETNKFLSIKEHTEFDTKMRKIDNEIAVRRQLRNS
jgi:hypothetical protein